jgi:hypothetical protein
VGAHRLHLLLPAVLLLLSGAGTQVRGLELQQQRVRQGKEHVLGARTEAGSAQKQAAQAGSGGWRQDVTGGSGRGSLQSFRPVLTRNILRICRRFACRTSSLSASSQSSEGAHSRPSARCCRAALFADAIK